MKGNEKIAVASNGRNTVKKGLERSVYKVKEKAIAAGKTDYEAASKTWSSKSTFKITVR